MTCNRIIDGVLPARRKQRVYGTSFLRPILNLIPTHSIQNGIMDLFALFEFLGKTIVNPLHEFSTFKSKIADPLKNKRTKIAMTRLAVVLGAMLLRRTKTMKIDGKPLLLLPKREIIEVKGPFLDP